MGALVRREASQQRAAEAAGKPTVPWLKLTVEAGVPPLTLFIWVWGAHALLSILLAYRAAEGPTWLPRAAAWCREMGGLAALFWLLFRLVKVAEDRLTQWAASTDSKWDDVFAAVASRALRWLIPLVGVMLAVPTLDVPAEYQQFFKQATSLALIGAVGFILFQLTSAVEEAVLRQYDVTVPDNLEARKIHTQVKVLKKIAVMVIVLFTGASMLMVFDSVRQLGTSILASAGLAGIIVGFAAQRSIATVLAGLQLALTQPIRLDDVVIVENEWGRIEEITLTYVVVRIWDLRRLVVPIHYFIERPFQNWTRVSADLLGTVFLYLDYTVPLHALREELDRFLAQNKLWDGKVKGIQVTNATDRAMEVRLLVSARDASLAWDLRCGLREHMIDFLQRHYPQALPRTRAELVSAPDAKALR
jgi:small-conductance mechanosensitive channel